MHTTHLLAPTDFIHKDYPLFLAKSFHLGFHCVTKPPMETHVLLGRANYRLHHHSVWRATLFLFIFLFPQLSSAAVIAGKTDLELFLEADVVALIAVLHTETKATDHGVITLAHTQVYRSFKGAADLKTLDFAVPGGKLDNGLHSVVAGSPHITTGQLFVGFFTKTGKFHTPWGLSFGLLSVHKDQNQAWRVSRHMAGLTILDNLGEHPPKSRYQIDSVRLDSYLNQFLPFSPEETPTGGLK